MIVEWCTEHDSSGEKAMAYCWRGAILYAANKRRPPKPCRWAMMKFRIASQRERHEWLDRKRSEAVPPAH